MGVCDCVLSKKHSMIFKSDIQDNKRVNLEIIGFAVRTREVDILIFQNDAYKQE